MTGEGVDDGGLQSALADAAFAFFAADQPLAVEDIAADGLTRRFSMAAASTPDWFAAAATKSSSLLDVAPELRGLGVDEPEQEPTADLIHIYGSDTVDESEAADESDRDIRWHLLKSIADLPD